VTQRTQSKRKAGLAQSAERPIPKLGPTKRPAV
jgi:hypothetical protein